MLGRERFEQQLCRRLLDMKGDDDGRITHDDLIPLRSRERSLFRCCGSFFGDGGIGIYVECVLRPLSMLLGEFACY